MPEYRLLTAFRSLFAGKKYAHRSSNLGDWVAMHFYEDLVGIGRSPKLKEAVASGERVLNVQNRRVGIAARRGDGTFGEIIPGEVPIRDPGYAVARGRVATVEIGVEIKILAKKMIAQVGRVTDVLLQQVDHFWLKSHKDPIAVAIVGVNHALYTTGYEGDRSFKTDGRKYKHPFQEAPEAERRLRANAGPRYDEFLILKYRAANEPPFAFEWVDYEVTAQEYGALLSG